MRNNPKKCIYNLNWPPIRRHQKKLAAERDRPRSRDEISGGVASNDGAPPAPGVAPPHGDSSGKTRRLRRPTDWRPDVAVRRNNPEPTLRSGFTASRSWKNTVGKWQWDGRKNDMSVIFWGYGWRKRNPYYFVCTSVCHDYSSRKLFKYFKKQNFISRIKKFKFVKVSYKL